MTTKIRITSEHEYGARQIKAYYTESPDQEAAFAFAMLERWGLVTAKPDGEDSAGRQKAAVLDVAETVERAFDVAREAYRVARARGLMVQLPDLNEINAAYDAKKAAKEAKEKA